MPVSVLDHAPVRFENFGSIRSTPVDAKSKDTILVCIYTEPISGHASHCCRLSSCTHQQVVLCKHSYVTHTPVISHTGPRSRANGVVCIFHDMVSCSHVSGDWTLDRVCSTGVAIKCDIANPASLCVREMGSFMKITNTMVFKCTASCICSLVRP